MKFGANPSEGSDSNYLKLKSGEVAIGVFRGEPHEFSVLWNEGKPTDCPAGTPGAKFRFRINFVTKKEGAYTPTIWEQGALVYNHLKTMSEDYELEKTIVKITRKGEKLDTEYMIMPIAKGCEVTPELEAQLSEIKLQDLSSEVKLPPAPKQTDEESFPF